MVKIRGIEFESNLDNSMGLQFHNLSHRWGFQCPNWPYFQDVKIERIHYMAKSGVLSQRICGINQVPTDQQASSRRRGRIGVSVGEDRGPRPERSPAGTMAARSQCRDCERW